MIATDDDSLMAPYGVGTTIDTVDVCETWTGSDYQYQAVAVGSSDDIPDRDAVQSLAYDAANLTGYDASGAESAPASDVGPTSFDFMYADESTRQASYDYPYYGVASPDPSTCLVEPCPSMSRGAREGSTMQLAPVDSLPRFARHGLTRRGVRALVESSDEITRSSDGHRRFRAVLGTETIIRSIDPVTQLLVGEVWIGMADTMTTTHVWKRVVGGYVRERSESATVEIVDAKKVRSSSVVTFHAVRVADPKFPLISGSR